MQSFCSFDEMLARNAQEQYRTRWNHLGDAIPMNLLVFLSWSEFAEGESAPAVGLPTHIGLPLPAPWTFRRFLD